MNKLDVFNQKQLKSGLPEFRAGDTVKVHQIIREKDKERVQIFEGTVIARKHGKGATATFTVRKISEGIGVEKTFPLHSPLTKKIEIVKRAKARRAKLYFIREKAAKEIRKKLKHYKPETSGAVEKPEPEIADETKNKGSSR